MPCAADGNTQQETADRVTTVLITDEFNRTYVRFQQNNQTKVCFIHANVHRINKVVHPKQIISTYSFHECLFTSRNIIRSITIK